MLIELYWALPYALKCLAASLQARRWDRQRHGPEFAATVAGLEERAGWTCEQLETYQASQLRSLVAHAASHVPYYREVMNAHGIPPDAIHGPADLVRLPILEKATLREHPLRLVDERLGPKRLIRLSTSGTTGTPLTLLSDIAANSARHAFMDARCRAVAGVRRRRDRSASLCGHLVAAPWRGRPPFWVENRRWRQLYLSSYHLSDANLGHYVDALRRFGATYIEGYPSSVAAVARYIIDRGLDPLRLDACITTAEVLSRRQRTTMERAFSCQVFDQYGCCEMVVFAAECHNGRLHLSPEMGIVEVLDDDDRPVPAGVAGRLVCTGLINRAQPLIRYRLGDVGALADQPCSCGSPLPVLDRVDGRTDDVIVTPDGRRIGRLDPVLKGIEGIVEAQIVQERLDRVVIRLVPGASFDDRTVRRLRTSLAQRIGPDIEIDIASMQSIERTPRGKLRTVVSRIGRPER